MAAIIRRTVKVFATLLVFAFGWLQFSGIDFAPIAQTLPADLILKTALALYYMSWVGGLLSDAHDQELVYPVAPNQGKLPAAALLIGVLLTITFGVLCFVRSYREFALVLAAFLVVNVVSWRYMVTKAMPRAWNKSRQLFEAEGRYVELEKLNAFADRYIAAAWQWYRFAFGGVSVLTLMGLAFTDAARVVGEYLGGVPSDVVLGGTVFIFVGIFEIWMWIKRARLKAEIELLDTVGGSYRLTLPNIGIQGDAGRRVVSELPSV